MYIKNVFGYRYGFNGKENDNEVKGNGNQQDYGMRVYDPRLGKFLSVDPIAKSFPWNSPYAFAENDVISAIDLDGLEKYIVHLADRNTGKTYLSINLDESLHSKGLYKYAGETKIYDQFERKEEERARVILDYARGMDKKNQETTGLRFDYKIKPKFGPSSSTITNENELESDFNWISERLSLNPNLKVNISSNLGRARADGTTDGLEPHKAEDQLFMDGVETTASQATIVRGNSIASKLRASFKLSDSQVNIKQGEFLLGKENRTATIFFDKKE